jgi:hypothetical protein
MPPTERAGQARRSTENIGLFYLGPWPLQFSLRHYPDVAGPTMKVGAVLRLHGLEAIGDAVNNWHLGVYGLG